MTAQFEPRDGYLLVVNRAAIGQRGRVLGDLELVADRDAQANPRSVDHGDLVALRAAERVLERERRFALCEIARFNPGCVLGNGRCEMLVRVAVGVCA
jgi:hypothetical protein